MRFRWNRLVLPALADLGLEVNGGLALGGVIVMAEEGILLLLQDFVALVVSLDMAVAIVVVFSVFLRLDGAVIDGVVIGTRTESPVAGSTRNVYWVSTSLVNSVVNWRSLSSLSSLVSAASFFEIPVTLL
jgi:hypothetical protein